MRVSGSTAAARAPPPGGGPFWGRGATGRRGDGEGYLRAGCRSSASLLTPGAASLRRSRPPAPRLDVASRRRHGRGTRCCRAKRAAAGRGPRRVWGLGAVLGRAHRGSPRGGRDRRDPSRLPTSRGIRSLQDISVFLRDAGAVTLAGGAGIPPRTLVRACALPAHSPPPRPRIPAGLQLQPCRRAGETPGRVKMPLHPRMRGSGVGFTRRLGETSGWRFGEEEDIQN